MPAVNMNGILRSVLGVCLAVHVHPARGHEYLGVPPVRTSDCLLNGVIMGTTICRNINPKDDQQCLDDRLM